MVVTLGQQYHVAEKPTVILYTTYINRLAGTPDKRKAKDSMSLDHILLHWIYIDEGNLQVMENSLYILTDSNYGVDVV